MRKATDGVSLAAINAKETTEGRWRGGGTGIGIDADGIGLMGMSMSGTQRMQTQRAKAFEAPARSSFRMGYVLAPMILLLVAAAWLQVSSSFVEVMGEPASEVSSGTRLGKAGAGLEDMGKYVVIAVPVLIAGAMGYFLFGVGGRHKEESRRFAAAQKQDEERHKIYARLRYVELDHIVFDPKSGREVTADRDAILGLIESLMAGANAA